MAWTVAVSKDGMTATLAIPAGAAPTRSELAEACARAGVVTGFDEAALLDACSPIDVEREVVVARGTPPVHGSDGRGEVVVDLGIHLEEDASGNVDWKAIGKLHEVAEGETVAHLVPPGMGVTGTTVTGVAVAARPGKPGKLDAVCGEGVGPAADGSDRLVALRSGVCASGRGGKLSVLPEVLIPGDQDMHWGHIETTCPVRIKGDIRTGFTMRTTADAEVGGCIEDARVSVRGNLRVRGGVLPGQERVKAIGVLHCRHAEQRVLKAGTLEVELDLRACTCFVTGGVLAKTIAGGTIRLRGSLDCDRLGSPDGMTTLIHAGMDPYIGRLRELARVNHDQLAADVLAARDRAIALLGRLRSEQDPYRIAQLRAEAANAAKHLDEARHRLASCEAALALPEDAGIERHAAIRVKLAVHPGVTLRIADAIPMHIHEPLAGGVFTVHEGKVVKR